MIIIEDDESEEEEEGGEGGGGGGGAYGAGGASAVIVIEDDDEVGEKARMGFKGTHNDRCQACGIGGDLLCCDSCNVVYHLPCLDPPLDALPEDDWYCPACVLEITAAPASSSSVGSAKRKAGNADKADKADKPYYDRSRSRSPTKAKASPKKRAKASPKASPSKASSKAKASPKSSPKKGSQKGSPSKATGAVVGMKVEKAYPGYGVWEGRVVAARVDGRFVVKLTHPDNPKSSEEVWTVGEVKRHTPSQ